MKTKKCQHGKRKPYCVACGGSQMCVRGRRKQECQPCGGHLFCEHGRRKAHCRPCGGTEVRTCEHGYTFRDCKFCRPRNALKAYKNNAKRRSLEFSLAPEQFHVILTLPCRYCGVTPSVGVDRLINNEGYTCTNSVPCCSICNSMKSRLSESEFYQHLEKIHARKQETA